LNEKINSFLYTIRLSSIFIFGWLISQKTLTTKQIEFILITAGALTATLGLFQFLFLPDLSFLAQFGWDPHYYRLASTFLDPNFMGSFLSLILLLIFFSLEKNILKYKKILFLLVYLALLLTFSRSAYLMFSLCFLTASFLQKSLKIFLITLILISGLFLGFKIYQNLVAQPHNVDRTASAQTRLSSWQQGFMIFTHSPLLGVGFNSYHYALREYNLASESQITGHGGSSNDSSLLFVLDTTGLIGLTVYLIFLGVIFKIGLKAWQNRLLLGTILIAFLLGLIIQSFFIDTLFYSFLLLPLILILASLESNFEKTK
jgi:O-antigen ligase